MTPGERIGQFLKAEDFKKSVEWQLKIDADLDEMLPKWIAGVEFSRDLVFEGDVNSLVLLSLVAHYRELGWGVKYGTKWSPEKPFPWLRVGIFDK